MLLSLYRIGPEAASRHKINLNIVRLSFVGPVVRYSNFTLIQTESFGFQAFAKIPASAFGPNAKDISNDSLICNGSSGAYVINNFLEWREPLYSGYGR